MAPPRKKPLPPGTTKGPRKASISSATGGASAGTHKHHRSGSKSATAAAAAAAALAAGSTSGTHKTKTKIKRSSHAPEQSSLPALERMDNGMRFTSFPVVYNINQKNYYTDYLKKDDQV